MADPLVIIGAGQAASQLMASLAQDGFAGEVCLVGDELHLPYQRPPLSKKFLAGELALDRLYVKPAAFYEKAGSRLLLGRRAERIDRSGRAVILADGSRLPYSTLVLATGSRPRELPLPGAFYLRNIADVDAIRIRLAPGQALGGIAGWFSPPNPPGRRPLRCGRGPGKAWGGVGGGLLGAGPGARPPPALSPAPD